MRKKVIKKPKPIELITEPVSDNLLLPEGLTYVNPFDIQKPKVYRAYSYQLLHCSECNNKMFHDDRDMSVQCMGHKCSYRGIKFKAPLVELVRNG